MNTQVTNGFHFMPIIQLILQYLFNNMTNGYFPHPKGKKKHSRSLSFTICICMLLKKGENDDIVVIKRGLAEQIDGIKEWPTQR